MGWETQKCPNSRFKCTVSAFPAACLTPSYNLGRDIYCSPNIHRLFDFSSLPAVQWVHVMGWAETICVILESQQLGACVCPSCFLFCWGRMRGLGFTWSSYQARDSWFPGFLSNQGTGRADTIRHMFYEREMNFCYEKPLISGSFCSCSITGSFSDYRLLEPRKSQVTELHRSFEFTQHQPTISFITVPSSDRKTTGDITEYIFHCAKYFTEALSLWTLRTKGLDIDISSFVQ